MPIPIVEKPEPLSEASEDEKPVLIASDALGLLSHELRQYCNCRVTGRSFLIAGHRGSGKTTLVQEAFQEVRRDNDMQQRRPQDDKRIPPLRPLLVLLQGPNLLRSEMEKGAPATGAAKASPESGDDGQEPSEMENVLIQITLGLYRSLAREFTHSFRAQITTASRGPQDHRSIRERLELAAQFELELDQYPSRARLREYWRRGGFLQGGVLGTTAYGRERFRGQGVRELIALSSASEIYRRICGTLSRKEKGESGAKSAAQAQVAVTGKGADLLKPVIALLTGGLAGTGVLAASPGKYIAACLTGFISALAASFAFKYSASWSQQRSVSQEDLFVPDLSVATLDRVLPVVINRIREAGLAPIFVVDELDKVVGLSDRITEMVRRLKKFVAENAFFCFLTDRAYFEEVRERSRAAAYPIEYTYFTNQIFVVFRHQQLHKFLDSVLAPPSLGSARVNEADRSADRSASEDATDRQVLPYILLYASQMHPIDLRRQLAALRDPRSEVRLQAGAVRSRPRFLAELMMQTAIEIVLEAEDMQAELDREPAFLRLAIDAVYYIPRCWHDAPKHLALDEQGEAEFESYLRDRMATDAWPNHGGSRTPVWASTAGETGKQGSPRPSSERPRVGVSDRRFLMECARDLAGLLAHPINLRERAKVTQRPKVVLDALPTEPLLYHVEGRLNVYRWRCYPSARTIDYEGADQVRHKILPAETEWKESAEFIVAFASRLDSLTAGSVEPSTLSSRFGIIGTTPAWTDVKRAIARLKTASITGLAYPEQDGDVSVLKGFNALIQRSGRTLTMAILCAEAIGIWQPEEDSDYVVSALRVISDVLSLRDMAAEQVAQSLENLSGEIQEQFGIPLTLVNVEELSSIRSLDPWQEKILAVRTAIRSVGGKHRVLLEFEEMAWRSWLERLQEGKRVPPLLSDIICTAAKAGPAEYLTFEFNSMTAGEWSKALSAALHLKPRTPIQADDNGGSAALDKESVRDRSYAPGWLARVALLRLGFDHLTEESKWPKAFGRPVPAIPDQEPPKARRTVALVVSTSKSRSVMSTSPMSKRGAAIVLDTDTVLSLVEQWKENGDKITKFLALNFIVFEMSADSEELGDEGRKIIEFFGAAKASDNQHQCVALLNYPLDQPHTETPWWYSGSKLDTISATNLDELFAEAERTTRATRNAPKTFVNRVVSFGS
jgi:hypothetical protein